jgi:hypothetical protein
MASSLGRVLVSARRVDQHWFSRGPPNVPSRPTAAARCLIISACLELTFVLESLGRVGCLEARRNPRLMSFSCGSSIAGSAVNGPVIFRCRQRELRPYPETPVPPATAPPSGISPAGLFGHLIDWVI